jgi:hypothetical protein
MSPLKPIFSKTSPPLFGICVVCGSLSFFSGLQLLVTGHLALVDGTLLPVNLHQPATRADGQLPFDKERLCSFQKHFR